MAEFQTLGELEVFTKAIKDHLSTEIRALGASIENLATEMRDNFREVKDRQDKTNGRIKKLEVWRAYIVGALAVLNTVVYPIVLIYLQNHIK